MKMDHLAKSLLLDECGRPLDARIRDALSTLAGRFARDFEKIRDEAVITSLFEKAGCAIAKYEDEKGPVERLHSFAWVTLRNLAVSWMRDPANRVELTSVDGEQSSGFLGDRSAHRGTVEEIETDILLKQILSSLSPAEREMVILRQAGFSSQEIAVKRGSSVSAVNTMMCRLKKRLSTVLPKPSRSL